MTATEHVKRQIAVGVVIAVEEPAFLLAVQGIVSRVEIEDDLFGRPGVGVEEQIDEQPLDPSRIVADLVIAGRDLARQFEPVQRRFAGAGAQSDRRAESLPASVAMIGSWRRSS